MENTNNITPQLLETIDRYLTDSMETGERTAFEAQMASDKNLAALVNEMQQLVSAVETVALREQLEEFHNSIAQPADDKIKPLYPASHNKRSMRWIYSAAALVLVLLGIFYFTNLDSPSERIFARNFVPDPGLPTTMSTSSEYDFFDAMVNYKREEYALAIDKWEKLLATKPENDSLNYFLGVSYLALEDAETAQQYLDKLQAQTESIFSEDVIYYRALALIKKGELQDAEQLLRENPSKRNSKLLSDLKQSYE